MQNQLFHSKLINSSNFFSQFVPQGFTPRKLSSRSGSFIFVRKNSIGLESLESVPGSVGMRRELSCMGLVNVRTDTDVNVNANITESVSCKSFDPEVRVVLVPDIALKNQIPSRRTEEEDEKKGEKEAIKEKIRKDEVKKIEAMIDSGDFQESNDSIKKHLENDKQEKEMEEEKGGKGMDKDGDMIKKEEKNRGGKEKVKDNDSGCFDRLISHASTFSLGSEVDDAEVLCLSQAGHAVSDNLENCKRKTEKAKIEQKKEKQNETESGEGDESKKVEDCDIGEAEYGNNIGNGKGNGRGREGKRGGDKDKEEEEDEEEDFDLNEKGDLFDGDLGYRLSYKSCRTER